MALEVVREGQLFDVQVSIEAGSDRPVDTAQVYLEFDPAALQVESVSPGHRLEYPLLSTWHNPQGQVAFAAGTLGPAVESSFTLCTVTFRASAQPENTYTQIRFAAPQNTHRTKVVRRGLDVTGQLSPLETEIR